MSLRVDRIVFHNAGFYQLRSAPGVVAVLEGHAARIAATANATGKGTYATSSRQGARRPYGRWRTTVITADFAAIRDNARNQTLLRSM